MKVALSSRVEVMLVTIRWLRVGTYRDDANYIFVFGHFLRCTITLTLPDHFLNTLERRS